MPDRCRVNTTVAGAAPVGYQSAMSKLIGLVILVLDILAIVDCLQSNKPVSHKALWIVLILLLPVVGLILYYLLGRKPA